MRLNRNMLNPYRNTKQLRNIQYEKYAGIIKIINAFNLGAKTIYDLAKYLHISETFLRKAINYYKIKYGTYFEIDTYIVYFKPNLGVMKKF